MDRLQGKRLDGRYELEGRIGSGGMANVYKAHDITADREVAIKILREEYLDNEELVRRFKNESKAISVLDHPNIVKVYDVSVSERLQYIVMEYLDGITLREYMDRRGDLTWKEALHFITQLLNALEHAHNHGVVHRDIKPQNIMLMADGNIKVMDFGIARLSRAEQRTVTDKAIGSVHYISPEQAKGDVTDRKSDIYSVGVLLYEMLTGRLPFESDTPVGVAIKQISDTPAPPRSIRTDIPEGLEAITLKAMAKKPADRYQTAQQMLADIDEFKQNPSIRFEYKYMDDNAPTRAIDKVVGKEMARKASSKASKPVLASIWKKCTTLPGLAGVAAAFAVCSLILIFIIFRTSGNSLISSKKDVTLPDFTGMSRTDIEAKAKDGTYEFRFTFDEIYNEDAEAGTVFDQSPHPPKQVKENAAITLKVSKGTEIVTIPDIYGYSRSDAQKTLTALGLSVNIVPEKNTTATENSVLRSDPERFTKVENGSTVTLYVATNQTVISVTVPEVRGQLSLEAAKKILENNGLIVGTISKREDSSPAGTVLDQTPVAGTEVNMGSQVNLTISSGITLVQSTITVEFAAGVLPGSWLASNGESFTVATGGAAQTWTLTLTGVPATSTEFSVTPPNGGTPSKMKVKFGTNATLLVIGPMAPSSGSGESSSGTGGSSSSSTPPPPSSSEEPTSSETPASSETSQPSTPPASEASAPEPPPSSEPDTPSSTAP